MYIPCRKTVVVRLILTIISNVFPYALCMVIATLGKRCSYFVGQQPAALRKACRHLECLWQSSSNICSQWSSISSAHLWIALTQCLRVSDFFTHLILEYSDSLSNSVPLVLDWSVDSFILILECNLILYRDKYFPQDYLTFLWFQSFYSYSCMSVFVARARLTADKNVLLLQNKYLSMCQFFDYQMVVFARDYVHYI